MATIQAEFVPPVKGYLPHITPAVTAFLFMVEGLSQRVVDDYDGSGEMPPIPVLHVPATREPYPLPRGGVHLAR